MAYCRDMTDLPAWLDSMASPLDAKLGLELTELTPSRVVGSIPVEGNQQPFGLLHGGASGVLVETLASMGAVAHGMPDGKVPVGVDLNVTHLKAVRSGRVTGVATALHLGRTLAVYQVEITDDAGRTTAIGRLTCRLIAAPAGS